MLAENVTFFFFFKLSTRVNVVYAPGLFYAMALSLPVSHLIKLQSPVESPRLLGCKQGTFLGIGRVLANFVLVQLTSLL